MKLIPGALVAVTLLAGVVAAQPAAADCYLGPYGYACYGPFPYYPRYHGGYYGYRHGYYGRGYYRGHGHWR